jgi:hypothetical protein
MKVLIQLKSNILLPDGSHDQIIHKGNAMLNRSGTLMRLSFPVEGVMQTLVFDENEPTVMELQRGGDRLFFELGNRTEGRYKTEYITLFPEIKTHTLQVAQKSNGIFVHLAYTLILSGEKQEFDMEIEVAYPN